MTTRVDTIGLYPLRAVLGKRVESAHHGRPQVIERNGQPYAVLMSFDDWRKAFPELAAEHAEQAARDAGD